MYLLNEISKKIKVSLFITCLVDILFPQVGVSMVKVLKRLGVEVDFPEEQTCCGQPAFNTGFRHDAKVLAKRFLSIFDQEGFIVSHQVHVHQWYGFSIKSYSMMIKRC